MNPALQHFPIRHSARSNARPCSPYPLAHRAARATRRGPRRALPGGNGCTGPRKRLPPASARHRPAAWPAAAMAGWPGDVVDRLDLWASVSRTGRVRGVRGVQGGGRERVRAGEASAREEYLAVTTRERAHSRTPVKVEDRSAAASAARGKKYRPVGVAWDAAIKNSARKCRRQPRPGHRAAEPTARTKRADLGRHWRDESLSGPRSSFF